MRFLLAFSVWLFLPAWCLGLPITPEHFRQAAEFSRTHGGMALRIEQDGTVLQEDYAPGYDADTPHRIYSGTKNFVAVTVLIAAQEGLLSLDEKASFTLPEWRDDRRRGITLRQLLSQTSGLDPGGSVIYPAKDQLAAAIQVHLLDPPGKRFHYGPVNYQVLGEILRRKLKSSGRTVEGYLRDRLITPLHLDIAQWKQDEAGNPLMHAGLYLTARQWAKFGALVTHHGMIGKKALINPKLFAELFVGTRANPAYGLSFWLNRPAGHAQRIRDLQPAIDGDQIYPGGPHDLYSAIGSEKQRLYMIPSLDLVIVRFGNEARFSDGDFLSRLFTGQPRPDAHTH